jgi:hypothetical protein
MSLLSMTSVMSRCITVAIKSNSFIVFEMTKLQEILLFVGMFYFHSETEASHIMKSKRLKRFKICEPFISSNM